MATLLVQASVTRFVRSPMSGFALARHAPLERRFRLSLGPIICQNPIEKKTTAMFHQDFWIFGWGEGISST